MLAKFSMQGKLKSQKGQLTFSQAASAAALYNNGIARANKVSHLPFSGRGLEDKHVPRFETCLRLGKVPPRAPEHRSILAQSATMHKSRVGFISRTPDLILVKRHDLTEGGSGVEHL